MYTYLVKNKIPLARLKVLFLFFLLSFDYLSYRAKSLTLVVEQECLAIENGIMCV